MDNGVNPDIYLISLARMKVHNDAVATLTLKNVVMAFGGEVIDKVERAKRVAQRLARGKVKKDGS